MKIITFSDFSYLVIFSSLSGRDDFNLFDSLDVNNALFANIFYAYSSFGIRIKNTHKKRIRSTRAVVLESGLGLESGLETFFYRLGLVLDSLVFGLGLVSDLVIGLAKCSSWSRPSPAIYAFFFSFKTKPLIWVACSANG